VFFLALMQELHWACQLFEVGLEMQLVSMTHHHRPVAVRKL
jgi:hypothetical protein